MIRINNLTRYYDDFKAVDNVSFEIKKGEIVGLLGHNGAGKTTIMKMITAFLEASSGNIIINGLDIDNNTREIQQRIGYLPENCPMWPEMTVIDYLQYQAGLHGIKEGLQTQSIAKAISRTALNEKATQSIGTLSRGYRQRVGVAQAILHEPDIFILDEPTNGLDPTQIRQMRKLIKELSKDATVIISTHILQEVQAVCDRVLIMRSGQLVVDSYLDELQSGQSLILTINNPDCESYLEKIEGIESIQVCANDNEHHCFKLVGNPDIAPEIVKAVCKNGDELYSLKPEIRNLETVFSEVSNVDVVKD